VTRAAYLGHEALTFSDYIDLDTGRTLAAVPGGTYDITPASGRAAPDIPEGWFVRVAPPGVGTWLGVSRELTGEAAAAEGGVAAPASEEDATGDEEPDGEQQDE
jgi:hypothetical protein